MRKYAAFSRWSAATATAAVRKKLYNCGIYLLSTAYAHHHKFIANCKTVGVAILALLRAQLLHAMHQVPNNSIFSNKEDHWSQTERWAR